MRHQDRFEGLLRRLRRFRLRQKQVALFEGLFLFVQAAAVLALLLVPAYALGARDPVFRWLLTLGGLGGIAFVLLRHVIPPLYHLTIRRNQPTLDRVALQIGGRMPQMRDELSNALQIVREAEAQESPSKDLAWAAFWQIAERVEPIHFEKALDTSRLKQRGVAALGLTAVAVLLLMLFPPRFHHAMEMFLAPWKDPFASRIRFEISPENAEILAGESVQIRARVFGIQPRKTLLRVSYQNGKIKETFPLRRDGDGSFSHRLENVTEPFAYRVQADGYISPSFEIRVIDLPDVRNLQLTVRPPRYTQLPEQTLEPNVGNLQVLPGTRVKVEVQTNKSVERAGLVFANGDTLFLQQDGEGYSGRFRVSRENTYFVTLQDERGHSNPNPIKYQIKLVQDQNPVVQIVFPGEDVDIDESMRVRLGIVGEDDYGFSDLILHYVLYRGGPLPMEDSGAVRIPFQAEQGRLQAEYDWDLAALDLLPEDVVAYHAVLYDNDRVSGPKKAVSKIYHLRFPSAQEIFAEAAQQQEEAEESFNEMLEKSREVQKTLENVLQEIRKDKEVKWEQSQKLKEEAQKQQEMLRDLEELKKKIDQMVDRLERNDLLSLETLKKYQELQQLLEEVATPELKKMMEKLNQALQRMDPKQIQKALEEMQFSQEEFLKSMERTINMLKRLKAEQKLEEAIHLAEKMAERQEEINQELAQKPSSEKLQELAQKEAQLQQQLQDVQRALEELRKQMESNPQLRLPEKPIEQAQQLAQSPELSSEMQQAQQQMQQGRPNAAQQSGQRAAGTLRNLQNLLSDAQQQMQRNQRAELMRELRRGSRNILELSKREEALAGRTQRLNASSPEYRNLANRQQDLLSAMQRVTQQLFELAKSNFFVPPEIGRKLGNSLNNMQQAIRQLEERQAHQASQSQQRAMQALNGAAAELRQAMQNIAGGRQQGTSFEQFMKQMMGISGEQRGINQQTQSLGQAGRLSLQQQAAMARLAAQQEALRKSLQELQREFGNRSEILGSLDQIAEDMKKAAEELRQKRVSRELIQRQQRILSRLLDAQKSVHRRELSRQRRAETGKTYTGIDPGRLPPDLGDPQTQIHQDLLRALRENYAKDYKLLIQKYFEALSKELGKDGAKK